MELKRVHQLKGEIQVPGDKSISHRAVMFGSIAKGITEVTNFLQGADCLSTIECFKKLGVKIENTPTKITVYGSGLHGLKKSDSILDTGNSGTTTRLISGILAGQSFETILTGDASIQRRPMKRIIEPLSQMGASIASLSGNDCAPLCISGAQLHGIHYHTEVASAQVKSAILLAGLYADSATTVTEPLLSRNHTEIMLNYFGADISYTDAVSGSAASSTIQPDPELNGQKINVPGDISSAAYFIAAALIVPNSEILIKNVGINPTRDGILKVCNAMGAELSLLNISNTNGEAAADILVRSKTLNAAAIGGSIIPSLIDELPILAVLACFAKGRTIIQDAQELKVKESNRIDVMVKNLTAMGAKIQATDDGMIIDGGFPLHGAEVDSKADHRIAMSLAIAALAADGVTKIHGSECVQISYPEFYRDLEKLSR